MHEIFCILYMFISFCCFSKVKAPELLNRDSLLGGVKTAKEDTNKVLLFISIGQQYEIICLIQPPTIIRRQNCLVKN